MKPRVEHLCIAILLSFLPGNILGQQAHTGYLSLNFDAAKPIGEFNDKLSKDVLWGFDLNGFLIPHKKALFWETGLQLGMLFPGERKDDWNGLELKTGAALVHFNLVSRFRPFKQRYVEPFFDIAGGLSHSSVTSSYEIVDRPTFLERFLLNEEDITETRDVKEFGHTSWNVGIGAGIIVNKILIVQVRYSYSPEVEFVNKEDVTVANGKVNYAPSRSTMETITFGIGLSLEKFMPKLTDAEFKN